MIKFSLAPNRDYYSTKTEGPHMIQHQAIGSLIIAKNLPFSDSDFS